MQIDYYAYHSGIKDWNSGIKVFMAVCTLILVILFDRIHISLFVILSMGAVTLIAGKLPWRVYLHYMSVPLTFIVLSCIAIALQFTVQPIGELHIRAAGIYICITKNGIMTASQVFFKSLAGMSALYMMSFSTPVNEVISVLQKYHLPQLLVELMHLIYRYIFILFDVAGRMQTSAKARLGYRNFMQSCRSFAGIAGNLFLISLKRANTYYDAMVSRGYDGNLNFLMEEKPLKLRHVVFCFIYFAVLFLLYAVR